MKKAILFFGLFFLSFNCLLANQENPVEYMNQIGQHYKEISKKTWEYTSALARDKNARVIDKKRTALLEEIKTSLNQVKKMKDYNGDASLRDTVAAFLQLNYDVLNEDYSKIADLEELAEQSYDMMEAYLTLQDLANEKLSGAGDRLNQVEKDFAKNNNITLIEAEDSKLTARLKKASKMWKYYNEIYLIFFKSYILEEQMLFALNQNDMNAAEQLRNSLAQSATSGLELLDEKESFEGDNTLVLTAKDILRFYKKEAEKDIVTVLDFHLKKEQFEKVNESFQKLGKKDQTQEAVDEYNKAVNDYNGSIENYNKVNEQLNKERSNQLDNWNKTSSKFTSKNVK